MQTPQSSNDFRQRAEELVRESPRDIQKMSEAEIQTLVHELQVHQIELQMQNEEFLRTQVELQESRDQLADLYDFAPVGYVTLDAHLRILRANLTVAAMLGIERNQLLGKRLSQFVSRHAQDQFYLFCRRLSQTGRDHDNAGKNHHYRCKQACDLEMHKPSGEYLHCRIEGTPFWPSASATGDDLPGVQAGEEETVQCRMVLVDTTATMLVEQALRKSDMKLRTVAETIPDILYYCDGNGRREYVNPQFYRFTGMLAGEAEGVGWQKAVHPEDLRHLYSVMKEAARYGKPWEAQFRVRAVNGDYHWFIGRAHPFPARNGEVEQWLGCDTDIDRLVRSEEALKEIDRHKDEFLAMLSHELRNPLAPIRNTLQLLRVPNIDAARLSWAREILDRNVMHMLRLVDDLLDIARIKSGTITLRKERIDLATVIERAIETVLPLIRGKNHYLYVNLSDDCLFVQGDGIRLTQIFTNILNNAAKYTAEGGRIELDVGSEGGYAVVRIKDNGMGIPAELLNYVFDMYRQDERVRNNAGGGLGVGLALVKKLVELHGGNIAAQSNGYNQGSEFIVRLPRLAVGSGQKAHAAEAAAASVPLPIGDESKHRILLVEDNRDVADSLAMLLEMDGHSVAITNTPQEGLAVAKQLNPDTIVLDIGLPGMDGYELARQLRAAGGPLQHALIIALSGYLQSAEDEKRAVASGIDHYLLKPADPAKLRKLLSGHPPSNKCT